MVWFNLAKMYVGTKAKNISKTLQRTLKERAGIKLFENHKATMLQAIIKSGKLEVNKTACLDINFEEATQ